MSAWAPPSAQGHDAAPESVDDAARPQVGTPRHRRWLEHVRAVRQVLAAIVAAAGVAAVVGVASRAGGLPGVHDPGRPARRELLPRVVLGVIAAVTVAVAVAFALHHRYAPRMRSGRRRRFGRTLSLAAPLLVLIAGFGALAGASTTPLRRNGAITRDAGFTLTARPVDADGDALPDADPSGNAVLGLDLDGDGLVDRVLVHCAGAPPLSVAAVVAAAQPGAARIQVAVDTDCDGLPERVVYLDPRPARLAPDVVRPDPSKPPLPIDLLNRGAERMRGTLAALAVAALVALAGLVLAGLVLALRGGRARTPTDRHPTMLSLRADEQLDRVRAVEAFGASIDAMLTDPDARTGIIGAYAKLLDGLSSAGLPRRPEEAPLEHLERCLDTLEVPPAPLERLTELFEIARFSNHPMHEGHRLDALDALRAALGHLAEQPEPAVAARLR